MEEPGDNSRIPKKAPADFQRLRLKSEFEAVRAGRKFVSDSFIMLYAPGIFGNAFKYGIICSRKFDKRAVFRNRARRLFKEAMRLFPAELNPAGAVFIPRRILLKWKMNTLREALTNAFQKAESRKVRVLPH